MNIKTVDNFNFKDRKALVRVDFNVPLDSNLHVEDITRIRSSVPTIKKILGDGGSVILISHLGRPKSSSDDKFSLKNIVPYLSEEIGRGIIFSEDCIGENTLVLSEPLINEVLLLENLRFHPQETKGNNLFAKKLASYADIYVNDAFATMHRPHSSVAITPKYFKDKCCGYLVEKEVHNINKLLDSSKSPFTAIVGGAKVSDKILAIEKLLDKVDYIIVGGGMAFTFLKARGGKIGNSIVENDLLVKSREILDIADLKGVKIILPIDVVCSTSIDNSNVVISKSDTIEKEWIGLDIGPDSIRRFIEIIELSNTVLWNGPMGVFEKPLFENGTNNIAKALAKATKSGCYSLVGGGDSISAIKKFAHVEEFSYISTGGGALIEYIEGKTLPGLKALEY